MKLVFYDGEVIECGASAEALGPPAAYTALQTEARRTSSGLLQEAAFIQHPHYYHPVYFAPAFGHCNTPPYRYFGAAPLTFGRVVELRAPFPAELNEEKAPTVSTSHSLQDQLMKKKKPEHQPEAQQQSYVKKPLNAYMLFLKEQRPLVKAEVKSKGGSAILPFLGAQWRNLSKKKKAKYFKEAEQQRLLHKKQNPGWSSKDNYGKKLTQAQKRQLERE